MPLRDCANKQEDLSQNMRKCTFANRHLAKFLKLGFMAQSTQCGHVERGQFT